MSIDTQPSPLDVKEPATFVLAPLPGEETIGQWLFRYSVIRSWRLGCPGFHWQETLWLSVLFWQDLQLKDRSPWYSKLADGVQLEPSLEDIVTTFRVLNIATLSTMQISVSLGNETIRYNVFRRSIEDLDQKSFFQNDELCFVAADIPTGLAQWQSLEIPGEEVLVGHIQHGQQRTVKTKNWRLTKQGLVQYRHKPFWRFW
ncbi:hypothetical protein DTL42_21665 [Bremerella cremea]|uniref:Uncharacterized protein n=1 Tax=Bremerella cremea TaxID=1031537 RepID=A0A368KMX6_9BACT|nr:hypothetical protein [Bremerella cremea]RCS41182.1 hypothetical protein DTL42_21665 [Bremerella cremea]